jgi:hypothetical protein
MALMIIHDGQTAAVTTGTFNVQRRRRQLCPNTRQPSPNLSPLTRLIYSDDAIVFAWEAQPRQAKTPVKSLQQCEGWV